MGRSWPKGGNKNPTFSRDKRKIGRTHLTRDRAAEHTAACEFFAWLTGRQPGDPQTVPILTASGMSTMTRPPVDLKALEHQQRIEVREAKKAGPKKCSKPSNCASHQD